MVLRFIRLEQRSANACCKGTDNNCSSFQLSRPYVATTHPCCQCTKVARPQGKEWMWLAHEPWCADWPLRRNSGVNFQLPAFRPSSQRLVSLPGVSSHSLLTVKVLHFLLPTHLTDSSTIIPSLLSQPAPECTFVPTVCQAPAKCWVDKAEDRLLCVSIVDGQADGNFNRRTEPDEVPRPDVL